MKKIKYLKDNTLLRIGKYGKVLWRLIRHDAKHVVITSTKSKMSRKVNANLLVWESELEP